MLRSAFAFYKQISTILANDDTTWTAQRTSLRRTLEAGANATKHHLRCVTRKHALTFEKLLTLLTEIEACLNSRPISPMTFDFDDVDTLTPAHWVKTQPCSRRGNLSRVRMDGHQSTCSIFRNGGSGEAPPRTPLLASSCSSKTIAIHHLSGPQPTPDVRSSVTPIEIL